MRYPGDTLEIEIELTAEECVALLQQAPQLLTVIVQMFPHSHRKEISNGKATIPLGLLLDAARTGHFAQEQH